MNLPEFLYRGANVEMHKSSGGRLYPKAIGQAFKQAVYYGDTGDCETNTFYNDGSTYGASITNAVIKHQQSSSKNRTSSVSTTPHFERAKLYATWGDKSGVVYKIDVSLLEGYGVEICSVEEHAHQPKIPEDEEYILVAKNNDALPEEIIVEVIEIDT